MEHEAFDHNSRGATVSLEVRFFNKLYDYKTNRSGRMNVSLPVGSRIEDLIQYLGLFQKDVYLVMINGRDISPGKVGDPVNLRPQLEDGDVVSLSGPVPMSGGYGSAII